MYKAYGPQGWWPTTPSTGAKPVYTPKKSLKKNTPQEKFEICLGAILTQNTSWENVTKALTNLKKNKKLHPSAVVSLPIKQLEKLIRSSGYFRQKAARVKSFFKGWYPRFLKGPTQKVRERLLALKGIGPETADSMLLYAEGHPIFVVDAYTRRIATRWGVLKGNESYDEIQEIFMKGLPKSVSLYGEMHALLVECAKEHCRKKPLCQSCPVKSLCKTGRSGGKS